MNFNHRDAIESQHIYHSQDSSSISMVSSNQGIYRKVQLKPLMWVRVAKGKGEGKEEGPVEALMVHKYGGALTYAGRNIEAASTVHPIADVFINFASFRSAAALIMAALKQPTIRVVAIIAESVLESDTKQLIAYAKANNKLLLEVFKMELLRLVTLLEQLITLFSASSTGLGLLGLFPNLQIWTDTNQDRSGMLPFAFDDSFGMAWKGESLRKHDS